MFQYYFNSLNSTEHTSSLSEVMLFQVFFDISDMFREDRSDGPVVERLLHNR